MSPPVPSRSIPDRLRATLRSAIETGVERVALHNRKRLAATASPFLAGIHRPMPAELTLTDLKVTGTIPAALNGRYLKMGANPVAPETAGQHWFLGDGMVHALTIENGRATQYKNRWIASQTAAAALHRPPAPGPRRGRSDTVNTNIVDIAGAAHALVEAGSFPVALSDDLESQRYTDFAQTLTGAFTGHPHRDPRTGEHHAIAYDGSIWDTVRHVVLSPEGRVIRDVPIPVSDGPCIHDCAITDRFVVVLDLPVTFSMRAVLAGHVFPFRWNPSHRARLGLLPRQGQATDIIWCDLDPCFVFHVANAHDTDDQTVILDVIAYDTMFASQQNALDAIGRLERWTIDPATRRISRRTLDKTPQEFPRIDERRFGQPYRHLYTVAVPLDGNPQLTGATRLYKHDLHTGALQTRDFGDGHIPGEFVFVPSAPDAAEDEGWLLGYVIDVAADITDFVILDAQDIEAPPLATIHLPHRIPPGFHGNWFPDR
jgi:carotenoid cleavage dioxygenase